MNLPACITRVRYYKISGHYTFAGDLIVTDGVLYFFPLVDLEDQRQQRSGGLLLVELLLGPLIYILTLLALLPFEFLGSFLRQVPRSSSKLLKGGLWEDGDSSQTLQRKLDAHIDEIRSKKLLSSSSLPVPSRFVPGDLTKTKLSTMGNLSFDAQYDHHDFLVGAFRKNFAVEALRAAGFMPH